MTGEVSVEALSVEATGETVGEAKWRALRELEARAPGLERESVRFQVVSEGERGILGVGYVPARVVATAEAGPGLRAPAPAQADESPLASRARGLVETIAGTISPGVRAVSVETDDELVVTCDGGDLGPLIGRHGQTIDALQYLCNAILAREEGRKPLTVDAAGYRDRRRRTLEELALRAAEQAARGERVALEPMTPVERKVVHERLKDHPGVRTASEGTEPNRCVVVFPA